MIWIIKTYVLFLRCKDTQESDQNPLPDDMMKRLPVKDFQDIPHQSKLGNSSKFKEMPRQAFPSMAGPAPKGVDLMVTRRITKIGEHSNPVVRSFVTFLWCGS